MVTFRSHRHSLSNNRLLTADHDEINVECCSVFRNKALKISQLTGTYSITMAEIFTNRSCIMFGPPWLGFFWIQNTDTEEEEEDIREPKFIVTP